MNGVKTFLLIVAMTGVLVIMGGYLYGNAGVALALVIGLIMNGISYFFSDAIVLSSYRAKVIAPGDAPELHAIVANLAQRAGLPMPALYVIHEDQPNAFATGRNPEHAAVAVNTGLLDLMSEEEVAGVVARAQFEVAAEQKEKHEHADRIEVDLAAAAHRFEQIRTLAEAERAAKG